MTEIGLKSRKVTQNNNTEEQEGSADDATRLEEKRKNTKTKNRKPAKDILARKHKLRHADTHTHTLKREREWECATSHYKML